MINLLPEQEKKELRKQENWQKFFVVLLFLTASLVFLSFLFWGMNYFVRSKAESLEEKLIFLEETINNSQFRGFQEETVKINQDLAKTAAYLESRVLLSPIFAEFSEIIPQAVVFSNFSLQKKLKEIEENGNKKTIPFFNVYVSGWAENRDVLYLFKKNLEQKTVFQKINFLPESWTTPKNINFSFSLNYEPR